MLILRRRRRRCASACGGSCLSAARCSPGSSTWASWPASRGPGKPLVHRKGGLRDHHCGCARLRPAHERRGLVTRLGAVEDRRAVDVHLRACDLHRPLCGARNRVLDPRRDLVARTPSFTPRPWRALSTEQALRPSRLSADPAGRPPPARRNGMPDGSARVPTQQRSAEYRRHHGMSRSVPAFHVMAKPTGARCNLAATTASSCRRRRCTRAATSACPTRCSRPTSARPSRRSSVPAGHGRLAGRRADADGARLLPPRGRRSKTYRMPGRQTVEHTLQTNGLLLDDDWCAFFTRERLPRRPERRRPARAARHLPGRPRRAAGLRPGDARPPACLQKHEVEFNILCTVNAANAGHPLEVYRFFRDELGAR